MFLLGINDTLTGIIQHMLTGRTFAVRLAECVSRSFDMVAGVPQGSVLGPLCFNIFMIGLPTHPICKNLQFADDTSVYVTHNDPGHAQNALNAHLIDVCGFFDRSKLELNPPKTELLHFLGQARNTCRRLRRGTRAIKISLRGHTIEPKGDIRLLGVRFQSNCRFTRHVDQRLAKARAARHHVGGLLRNRHIDVSGPDIRQLGLVQTAPPVFTPDGKAASVREVLSSICG